MLSAHVFMWYTTSRHVSPIKFHIHPPSPRTHTCVQWGNTPLLIAAAKGHAEVAHFLLDNGSNVHEQNDVSRLKRILSACDI